MFSAPCRERPLPRWFRRVSRALAQFIRMYELGRTPMTLVASLESRPVEESTQHTSTGNNQQVSATLIANCDLDHPARNALIESSWAPRGDDAPWRYWHVRRAGKAPLCQYMFYVNMNGCVATSMLITSIGHGVQFSFFPPSSCFEPASQLLTCQSILRIVVLKHQGL